MSIQCGICSVIIFYSDGSAYEIRNKLLLSVMIYVKTRGKRFNFSSSLHFSFSLPYFISFISLSVCLFAVLLIFLFGSSFPSLDFVLSFFFPCLLYFFFFWSGTFIIPL
jgi:hypothetical protein